VLRLDFPGYSGAGKLQPIEWDEWFEKFDSAGLALLYQETTKGGQPSNFNKLISRNQSGGRSNGSRSGGSRSGGKRSGGSSKGRSASSASRSKSGAGRRGR